MAPKVCVPADFGRHHIGEPSHGNLTFVLQDELEVNANSIILALNSPVIDEYIANIQLESVDATDFSKEAVDCFIEAMYTGEVEALNKSNFIHVNRLGTALKVNWLVDRCEKFLLSHLDTLNDDSSYFDLYLAVEEAEKEDVIEIAFHKIMDISTERRLGFINQYLSDFSSVSAKNVDACIALVGYDVHILMEILIDHMKNNATIHESAQYMFMNLNIKLCLEKKPDLRDEIFAVLESLPYASDEQYKVLIDFKLKENVLQDSDDDMLDKRTTVALAPFTPYVECSDLIEVINMLVKIDIVDNLYKVIDGIWLRAFQCESDIVDGLVIKKLVEIKMRKRWAKVDRDYVDYLYQAPGSKACSALIGLLKGCDELVVKRPPALHCSSRELYDSSTVFIQRVFKKNSYNFFQMDGPDDNYFLLSSTQVRDDNPEAFNMKWSDLLDDRQPWEMPKLHLALETWKNGKWSILPITWCGKPTFDSTKTTWNWGYISFGKEMRLKSVFEKLLGGKLPWNPPDDKFRFVLFKV